MAILIEISNNEGILRVNDDSMSYCSWTTFQGFWNSISDEEKKSISEIAKKNSRLEEFLRRNFSE